MSAENRSEYEVFKLLRECAILGLAAYGYAEGTKVQRFAQANMNIADRVVLMHLLGHSKIGWQAARYYPSATASGLKRAEEWVDEQHWSVSVLKRMQQDDKESTETADDIALALVTWFNGPGLDWLRTKGMATLPIDPTEIMVYNDDSQLYQRKPFFEMVVQVPRAYVMATNEVSGLEVETHPV